MLLAGIGMPVLALAQETAKDPIVEKVSQIVDKIPTEGVVIVVLTGVLDFVFRMIKTEKPKSIVYLIADMFKLIGKGLAKIGELMDKVLPQRLK